MKSSTGRWVSGDNFFDRENELRILESRVRDGNHVLLTGQRRMGKTSLAQELGRRLKMEGWSFLYVDVEGATCPEDVIADIGEAVHPIRSIASRFAVTMGRWVGENVEEISASEFRVKIRAGLSGSWQRWGRELIGSCAEHDRPVLLVVDELPIFLMRMLRDEEEGVQRVDEFLSWFRSLSQGFQGKSPVFMVSDSIGLVPLVQRLGMPDRINHLHPCRLGLWSRHDSVECFKNLAESHNLPIDEGVADAVYEAPGVGIPHHVQSYFAHLQDFVVMRNLDRVKIRHVLEVYRTELLGPAGQSDLSHYETRLRNAMDEDSYRIAMEILAEAATLDVFMDGARHRLESWYSPVMGEAPRRIGEALDVLIHDGYLESGEDGHRFPFKLLKDWWLARFRDNRVPITDRVPEVN
ncbi:MAG: ATP-binding protein [Roseovarius sp.]|nr:ATP-binding protein [Roseovarius sp.]